MEPVHYRAILAYDGADYHGFQKLGNADPAIVSVAGKVEQALAAVSGGQQVTVIGAGRTDAGVHATGQVIAFDLDWKHPDDELLRAVNAKLPTDIAMQRLDRAEPDFHPRYDATSRVYQYFVYEAQIRQPMMARMSWWVRPPVHTRLDVEAMNWAAAKLLGTHDFASFGNPPQRENVDASTIRHVYQSEWFIEVPTQGTRLLSYCIEANAFLYRMVRTIVAALVDVGLNRVSIAEYIEAFQAKDRARMGKLAPPHGLTLTEVTYDRKDRIDRHDRNIDRSGVSPAGES